MKNTLKRVFFVVLHTYYTTFAHLFVKRCVFF